MVMLGHPLSCDALFALYCFYQILSCALLDPLEFEEWVISVYYRYIDNLFVLDYFEAIKMHTKYIHLQVAIYITHTHHIQRELRQLAYNNLLELENSMSLQSLNATPFVQTCYECQLSNIIRQENNYHYLFNYFWFMMEYRCTIIDYICMQVRLGPQLFKILIVAQNKTFKCDITDTIM